jgi:DNA-binding NtrC family response regulator
VEHKENVISSHQVLDINGDRIPYDKSIIVLEDTQGNVESVIGLITRVAETVALRDRADGAMEYFDIVTKNQAMRDMFTIIEEVAHTDAPVLITGETGTGKELVATAIQQLSHRRGKPFVRINCSALTESLLESELFGHVKGAFTGATSNYAGKFKSADGGTILLDEIEDMSPGLQAKLLRVLESQEFEPVGSNRLETVDVRLIAAANVSLPERITAGSFRSDLYYRLNVIRIDVPALRERKEDIPVLVEHRLTHLRARYHKDISSVSTRGLAVLIEYDWPGNVRQLFGALEYAFLRAKGARIERNDLPTEIYVPVMKAGGSDEAERLKIEKLLSQYPGNRRRVAFELGISRTTLWRKIRELGISS